MFDSLNNPHKRVHDSGKSIIQAIKDGNIEKANSIYENETQKCVKQIERIFSELI